MGKLKLSLDDARSEAERLVELLAPACERIRVAGSIRRRCEYVGDIELVTIPKVDEQSDMFGRRYGQISQLDEQLGELVGRGVLQPGDKNGSRYKQLTLPRWGMQVDLFITTPERWGVVFMIRTGSADFSRWMVTSKAKGGALPLSYRINEGRVWVASLAVDTPEEEDVFEAVGVPWIEPPARKKGFWRRG